MSEEAIQFDQTTKLLMDIESSQLGTEPSSSSYFRYGRWWLSTRTIRRNSSRKPGPLWMPDVHWSKIVQDALRSGGGPATVMREALGIFGPGVASRTRKHREAPVAASGIWARKLIVAVYQLGTLPGDSCILKTGLNPQRVKNALSREAANLAIAHEHAGTFDGTVIVPYVIRDQTGGDVPFFLQELVHGEPIRFNRHSRFGDPRILNKVLRFLLHMYRRERIEWAHLSEAWPILLRGEDILESVNKRLSEHEVQLFANALRVVGVHGLNNQLVPVSRVHGDLQSGNMLLRPDGTVAIIDWGLSGHKPVISDFGRLQGQVPPRLRQTVVTALDELGADRYKAEFPVQLFALQLAHLLSSAQMLSEPEESRQHLRRRSDTSILKSLRSRLEICDGLIQRFT